MPMEAGSAAMSTTVQPVQRPREEPGTSGTIRREGEPSSPFAPKTNVNIENSVSNMAGILAKISSRQEGSMESLSPQLQKLIDNIMKQSFSLETTLANGLGSTVESQRFSVDELLTLSRLLGQLGTLAEEGVTNPMDSRLETLLAELKPFFTQAEGQTLEPALLHKLAFELLDAKSPEDLPPELQYLLQQMMGETGAQLTAPSESLGFLKQLLQYFMPSPSPSGEASGESAENLSENATAKQGADEGASAKEMAGAKGNLAAQSAAPGERGPSTESSAALRNPAEMAKSRDGQAAGSERAADNIAGQRSEAGKTAPDNTGRPGAETTGGGKAPSAQQEPTALSSEKQDSQFAGSGSRAAATAASKGGTPGGPSGQQAASGENAASDKTATHQQEGKSLPQNPSETPASRPEVNLPRPLLQNTPQTMETMKQLASLLLKDATLTEQDAQLLQNFINDKPGVLSEKDAKQLQLLLRLCQNNIPASVQQAAQQQNLPDLPKLWAFMQLCDLAYLKEKNNPASLKKASKDVAEFASLMKGAMASENSQAAEGQRSMSFMVPLYMGDQEKTAFPAYIHVYDESEEDPSSPGEMKKETWLRVCLLTENIGAVDLTFRMYEKHNLDVRVLFSDKNMVKEFGEYIPEFEESFAQMPLVLKDLKVAMAGEPA